MNKLKIISGAVAFATIGLFSFTNNQTTSIKGTVSPANSAIRAWAISPTDTFRANVAEGNFAISNVKANTYRIVIETSPSFKNTAKDNVVVTDGQSVDVGEIKVDSTGK